MIKKTMDRSDSKIILDYAKEIINHDAEAVAGLANIINQDFVVAVNAISEIATSGHVIISGMGKAGIIGMKISATLASIGVPSFFLHPAEALHGDLGRFSKSDLAVLLSNSGETDEIIRIIPSIRKIGSKILAITGNPQSNLAKNSDILLLISNTSESGPLGIAPTTSTSMMLALGDALAMCVQKQMNVSLEDFAMYHPGGSLGKLLLKAKEIMRSNERLCLISEKTSVRDAVRSISSTAGRPGAAAIIDSAGKLVGIFTDGDLNRCLVSGTDFLEKSVDQFMGKSPKTVSPETIAQDVLKTLSQHSIDQVIVVNQEAKPLGMIDIQDLI